MAKRTSKTRKTSGTSKPTKRRIQPKTPPPYKEVPREELKVLLDSADPTAGYRNRGFYGMHSIIEDLPVFRLRHAMQMMFDPKVRFGLTIRDAALSALKIKVDARNEKLRNYIGGLWKTLWGKYSRFLLKTKRWGYGGFQMGYGVDRKTGYTTIESIKDFAPQDVRPLIQSSQVVGLAVRGGHSIQQNFQGRLFAPRALWTTFDAEQGRHFGQSILVRSYGPWYEKWMDHGAKKTTQLRMIKDAYRGDWLTYPPDRVITLPNGEQVPWRDVAREVVENTMSGSTIVTPQMFDSDGNPLVNYTPPSDTGNPVGIWTWGDNLNIEIWQGMSVFEEVIQAAQGGTGFSGRSVPLMMFLQSCMDEAQELVDAIDRDVLKPLAWLNFGDDPEYKVEPVSLIETFAEAVQGSAMGGGAMGGPQSQGGPQQDVRGQNGAAGGQPGREPSQFVQFRGKRGGIGAQNTQTGTIVRGERARQLLQMSEEEEGQSADQQRADLFEELQERET